MSDCFSKGKVMDKNINSDNITNDIFVPIVVGGGIRSPKSAHDKVQAGASFIVIGSAIEDGSNQNIKEFADAIHRS